ncbi:hypothetical protein B0H34DRAFT_783605 [Crassisporium funariophilum]|nr:hypothetical protein B0H34DRAFT_783605 [Crassisporium funariophilum]
MHLPQILPGTTEDGQIGTNQHSNRQNAYSIVQYGTGARLIPDGAINGAHLVQTSLSRSLGLATRKLTMINVPADEAGVGEFCFRACKPGPKAGTFCQHNYHVIGCEWDMSDNNDSVFEACQAPVGVYCASTFLRGQPAGPPAHYTSIAPVTSILAVTTDVHSHMSFTTSNVGSTSTFPLSSAAGQARVHRERSALTVGSALNISMLGAVSVV